MVLDPPGMMMPVDGTGFTRGKFLRNSSNTRKSANPATPPELVGTPHALRVIVCLPDLSLAVAESVPETTKARTAVKTNRSLITNAPYRYQGHSVRANLPIRKPEDYYATPGYRLLSCQFNCPKDV